MLQSYAQSFFARIKNSVYIVGNVHMVQIFALYSPYNRQ